MKAVCKLCTGGRTDPLIIVSALGNSKYFVHCPNCDTLYLSKKSIFSAVLKNEYAMPVLKLIEYVNNILDNSITSIRDVLENKAMFKESVILYLISEGHVVADNQLGVKDKNGEYIDGVFLTNIYDDNERREAFRGIRIENIKEAQKNPKDPSEFTVPWEECAYC